MQNNTVKEVNMKIYHLSHTDLDGFGCHVLTTMFASDVKGVEVSCYNSNYGNEIDLTMVEMLSEVRNDGEIDKKKLFLITDLNLTEEQASFIEEETKNLGVELVLLDHHLTGKSVAENREWYHLDETKSGTLLTYQYLSETYQFENHRAPEFAEYVNTYDMWKEDDKLGFELGKIYSYYINLIKTILPPVIDKKDVYEITRNVVSNLGLLFSDELIWDAVRHEIIILAVSRFPGREEDDKIRSMQKAIELLSVNKILEDIEYNGEDKKAEIIPEAEMVIYYSKSSISSAVMNSLLKERPEFKAIVTVNESGLASLRSVGDYNVSSIAKELGGGGHLNASGCRFENLNKESPLEDITSRVKDALSKLKNI